MPEPPVRRHSTLLAVFLFAFWLVFYLGSFQAVQPWGSRLVFDVVMAQAALLWPLALFAPVLLLGAAWVQRRMLEAAVAVLLTVGSVGALFLYSHANWSVRRHAAERVVMRARPVIDAIKRYERDHNSPPASLDALVPRYIAEIPTTGLGAFPTFDYVVEKWIRQQADPAISQVPAVDPWSLRVSTPLGFLNWDILLYLPSQQYPEYGYGGKLSRIQEWAYVHE